MKKFILGCVLFLTACASTPRGIDTSSNCMYDVKGNSCERMQVWQMRDAQGRAFRKDHTAFWFKKYDNCMDFVNDPDNYDFLNKESISGAIWCGDDGRQDTSADINTYYIYDDGKKDGEFYYIIPTTIVSKKEENKREYFTPIFTSKEGLLKFQRTPSNKMTTVVGYSIYHAERIKIKQMD